MKIETKQALIDSAAKRIKLQYYYRGKWKDYPWNPQKRYEEILRLPKDVSEAQVIKILGNSSWTELICDECDIDSEIVVVIGKSSSYENSTAQICLKCLLLAIQLTDEMNI